jgi:hypothetical protein
VAYDTFPATDAFPADDIFPAGVLLIPVNASISLDLFAEVTTADGTRYKWNANEAPGSRPINLSYRSKIGEGFSDASLQLPRRIDLDYADLNLGDTVSIVGADGSIVYEGYVAAMPRELSDRHVIGVTLTGWMAHAKDRQFQEIYVDRDVGQWGDMPIERKAAHLTGGNSLGDFSYAADMGGLVCAFPNQALGTFTNSEAWYAAPPSVTISRVGYRGKATSLPAGWTQTFMAGDSRAAGSETYTPTLDDTLRSTSLTTARRYLAHTIASAGTAATPASGASVVLSKLAVYGSHGLTTHAGDSTEPDGLYLSDILKNVAQRYCPFLDTSGVQTNTYVVQHCAFRDPTFPYDAFLELNKYALWHLGVWDNKQLVYKPYDLTDYDWEIRTDDPGITFAPQGPVNGQPVQRDRCHVHGPIDGCHQTGSRRRQPRRSGTRPRRTRGPRTADGIGMRSRSPHRPSRRKLRSSGGGARGPQPSEDTRHDHRDRLHPGSRREPPARVEGPRRRHDRRHELQRRRPAHRGSRLRR